MLDLRRVVGYHGVKAYEIIKSLSSIRRRGVIQYAQV